MAETIRLQRVDLLRAAVRALDLPGAMLHIANLSYLHDEGCLHSGVEPWIRAYWTHEGHRRVAIGTDMESVLVSLAGITPTRECRSCGTIMPHDPRRKQAICVVCKRRSKSAWAAARRKSA